MLNYTSHMFLLHFGVNCSHYETFIDESLFQCWCTLNFSCFKTSQKPSVKEKNYPQQECIPVGCVPSAAVAVSGGVHPLGRHHLGRHPLGRHHPGIHPLPSACWYTYPLPSACWIPPISQNDRRLCKHYLSVTTVADGNKLQSSYSEVISGYFTWYKKKPKLSKSDGKKCKQNYWQLCHRKPYSAWTRYTEWQIGLVTKL